MKKLRQKKAVRKLVWYIIDAILWWLTAFVAGYEWSEFALYATIAALILERVTKYVNVELLNDRWVSK